MHEGIRAGQREFGLQETERCGTIRSEGRRAVAEFNAADLRAVQALAAARWKSHLPRGLGANDRATGMQDHYEPEEILLEQIGHGLDVLRWLTLGTTSHDPDAVFEFVRDDDRGSAPPPLAEVIQFADLKRKSG